MLICCVNVQLSIALAVCNESSITLPQMTMQQQIDSLVIFLDTNQCIKSLDAYTSKYFQVKFIAERAP
eukprot:snap_masked-scaffold_17-processed-gene-4.12-mRNA-1 protein AED:1.00 eAED:1.00 QI:0/0/0/0/1/1/2/0/67